MDDNTIYILGIGHNTPVFMDYVWDCGYNIGGLYHYCSNFDYIETKGYPLLGTFDDLFASCVRGKQFLLTMGNMDIRKKLTERILQFGGRIPSVIHPTAVISRYSKISNVGVIIGPFSNIQANSQIDSHSVILSGVVICHNVEIGQYCFIADGGLVGAYTKIEDNVFFGQGALSISDKVELIGKHSLIGARSLLTKRVDAGSVMYGIPAMNH